MFAKHLLQSVSFKRPQPTFSPSTTGEYIDPANGRRYRLVIDGSLIRVFRRGSQNFPATYISSTTTNAGGQLGLVPTGGNIELYQADNTGPQALLGTLPPLGTSPHYIVPNLALKAVPITGGRRVTPYDLGTGAVGADIITSANLSVFLDRSSIYFVPDLVAAATGTISREILPASGGRNQRCRIYTTDDGTRPLCYRVVPGAGVEPVTFTPWRRPLTVDTCTRVFSWAQFAGTVSGTWSIRGGVNRRISRVSTSEIEVGPSTGIVEIPSGRCSRHVVSIYDYASDGVLSLTGGAVSFVTFRDQLRSGAITALQYLDAGDVPSGEFVIEASQSWPTLQSGMTLTTSGITTPQTVTMDGYVRMPSDSSTAQFFDFDGNLIRSVNPPGGSLGASAVFIQHANMFGVARVSGSGYVMTSDQGVTWNNYDFAGGIAPAGYYAVPGQQLFDITGFSGWQPLFIT